MRNRNPQSVKQVLARLAEIDAGIDRALEPVPAELQRLFDRIADDVPLCETSMRAIRRVQILDWRLKQVLECPTQGCTAASRLDLLRAKNPWRVRSSHLSAATPKFHGIWRVVPPLRLATPTGSSGADMGRDDPIPIAERISSAGEFFEELGKVEAHVQQLLAPSRGDLAEVYSKQIAGMVFGTTEGNRRVIERLLAILNRLLLACQCPLPDCGLLGRLCCNAQAFGVPWNFRMAHYLNCTF